MACKGKRVNYMHNKVVEVNSLAKHFTNVAVSTSNQNLRCYSGTVISSAFMNQDAQKLVECSENSVDFSCMAISVSANDGEWISCMFDDSSWRQDEA